ncbi:unnamed protein product, partial [Rotaria sp. Silwood1]
SNISNDPIGIKFQWRKSNTERIFHQALGVNERFRTKSVPLTPEVLQPEKLKQNTSTNNESEHIDNENKVKYLSYIINKSFLLFCETRSKRNVEI